MELLKNRATVVFYMVLSLITDAIFAQDRIEMKCNPSINHRFEVCPENYCCVRDEFLPTYVYCAKIGPEDENCTTKENESECPCANGLYCKPNIISSFQSLYGRCHNSSRDATTASTTTAATTPSSIMNTTSDSSANGGNNITAGTTDSPVNTTSATISSSNDSKPQQSLPPFKVPVIG